MLKQVQNASAEKRTAIFIAAGEYSGETIQLKDNVDLYGGFNERTWERDIEKYTSTLSGDGERRILIAANSTIIDGFYFKPVFHVEFYFCLNLVS